MNLHQGPNYFLINGDVLVRDENKNTWIDKDVQTCDNAADVCSTHPEVYHLKPLIKKHNNLWL